MWQCQHGQRAFLHASKRALDKEDDWETQLGFAGYENVNRAATQRIID